MDFAAANPAVTPEYLRIEADGLTLFVRLTPKAASDALDGVKASADGRSYIHARVRAVPEDGKANKALEKLLAKSLKHPASAVQVIAGATSRLKQVKVTGIPDDLLQKLDTALSGVSKHKA